MSNSTSLRPAARALLAATTVAAGVLAVPATIAPATAATATATTTSVSSTPTTESQTTARQARIERRHRRWVRLNRKALRAFKIAKEQKGDPYRYGATGPNAFDCSGLTSYAYHRAGLRLPRTSSAQSGAVRHIARSKLRRGDLVFFTSGGHVYHVGLYAGHRHGGDYVLHAPYSGRDVETERIWTGSWFGGTLR